MNHQDWLLLIEIG